MINLIKWLILTIYNILPDSPFQSMVDSLDIDYTYMQYLNWFLPVDIAANMFLAWLDCILVYVVFSFAIYLAKKIAGIIIKGAAAALKILPLLA